MNKDPIIRLTACRLKNNVEISPDKIYKFREYEIALAAKNIIQNTGQT